MWFQDIVPLFLGVVFSGVCQDIVPAAKRPVIHVSRGIGAGGEKLVELSKELQIPLVLTGLAKGSRRVRRQPRLR
ncbi:hypothetical protein ACHEUQ_04520 [Alloscardovia omnicolens]|uniref:hypothetical protein n=1 Tax=Alloscardovia omnicolens TaxID=419015 RepID=UPI00375778CE